MGGAARYGVGVAIPRRENGIPWATLTVNVVGAFVLAILLVLILDLWPPRRYLRPLVCTGFLGAFTTFSSLAVETDQLVQHGSLGTAAAYVGLTFVVGFAAAALGLTLGHRLTRRTQHATTRRESA
jgi:CrcB protein